MVNANPGSKAAVCKPYLHKKLWLYLKSEPLIKSFPPHHKDSGLWCSRAKALWRTVLPQSAINKDATTKLFIYLFVFSSCVSWMLLCSFVIRWEMAPTFSAFKSSPDTSWVGGFWPIWRHFSCCKKRHHYYLRLWSWHLSLSNGEDDGRAGACGSLLRT